MDTANTCFVDEKETRSGWLGEKPSILKHQAEKGVIRGGRSGLMTRNSQFTESIQTRDGKSEGRRKQRRGEIQRDKALRGERSERKVLTRPQGIKKRDSNRREPKEYEVRSKYRGDEK